MNQTLLFQRHDAIYALPHFPRGGCSTLTLRPRLLATIEGLTFDGYNSVWNISRDGSHIVYRQYLKDFGAEPSVVRIAHLPGLRENRILFRLNRSFEPMYHAMDAGPYSLRAANGAVVRSLSVAREDEVDTSEGCEEESLGNREVNGLRWSSRGTEIYVSLKRAMPFDFPVSTTCAIDVKRGFHARTDRHGKWQRLLAATINDERNGLLIGVGNGRTTDGDACNACSRYHPIYVAEQSHQNASRSLLPPTFDSKHIPPYASAGTPVLSPNGRAIVFAAYSRRHGEEAQERLWLVDRYTRHYWHLAHWRNVRQIAWESPTSLLILKAVHDYEGFPDNPADLYRVTLDPHYRSAHRPVRLIENVDRFQLLDVAL